MAAREMECDTQMGTATAAALVLLAIDCKWRRRYCHRGRGDSVRVGKTKSNPRVFDLSVQKGRREWEKTRESEGSCGSALA